MQTDGYVKANRHFFFFFFFFFFTFYIFHFERTKLHSVYDSENEKKKIHTMGVPTLIFFVLMCLRIMVHNNAQGQLCIPEIFICGLCSEMEVLP